jgi:hypothetical protein
MSRVHAWMPAAVGLVLVLVSASAASADEKGEGPVRVKSDPHFVVAQELEGTWVGDADLTKTLGGRAFPTGGELTFRADKARGDEALAVAAKFLEKLRADKTQTDYDLPEMEHALAHVALAGEVVFKLDKNEDKDLFLLAVYRGNPTVFGVEGDGDLAPIVVHIARDARGDGDLLFWSSNARDDAGKGSATAFRRKK